MLKYVCYSLFALNVVLMLEKDAFVNILKNKYQRL